MITSQTIRAPSVVKPHGRCTFYVVNRTELLAKPALDTGMFVDPEFLVGNQVLVVVAANDISIGKGNAALHQFLDIMLALGYDLADMHHALAGRLDFLAGLLVSIQMEERKADIRLGHHNGKTGIGLQTFLSQFLIEYPHGIAHIVATSSKGVDIC